MSVISNPARGCNCCQRVYIVVTLGPQVSCGEYHSAALTGSGEVYTWGDGGDGQLGHGDWRTKGTHLAALVPLFCIQLI